MVWNSNWSARSQIDVLMKEIKAVKNKIKNMEKAKIGEIDALIRQFNVEKEILLLEITKLEKSKKAENDILKKKIAKLERENLYLRINDLLNLKFLKRKEAKLKWIFVKNLK